MIRVYRIFPTQDAAESFKADYLAAFDPRGYATSLQVFPEGDEWVVSGHRFSSCD